MTLKILSRSSALVICSRDGLYRSVLFTHHCSSFYQSDRRRQSLIVLFVQNDVAEHFPPCEHAQSLQQNAWVNRDREKISFMTPLISNFNSLTCTLILSSTPEMRRCSSAWHEHLRGQVTSGSCAGLIFIILTLFYFPAPLCSLDVSAETRGSASLWLSTLLGHPLWPGCGHYYCSAAWWSQACLI